MSAIVCYTRGLQSSPPDKTVGPEGKQLRMWIRQIDGHHVCRIEADAGFDWTASVKPLPPDHLDWCPMTHFGYLESGAMRVRMQDGTEQTVCAGETYFVSPGHLPVIEQDTVMIEFSQNTTYTNPLPFVPWDEDGV